MSRKEKDGKAIAKFAKTNRGKRLLKDKSGKLVENPKRLLVVPGHKTSQIVKDALTDIARLKGLDCKKLSRNNDILPFEPGAEVPLQFMCERNDCSTFLIGNHTKKRPHNLVLGRTFDFKLLDMVELGVERFRGLQEFKGAWDYQLGNKPCFVFAGQEFETKPEYGAVKSLLLDMFRGQQLDKVNLKGLDHLFSVVAHDGRVLFRHYTIRLKKSGTKVPRVDLVECGPSMDFSVRRYQAAPDDLLKEAMRTTLDKKKKQKNVGFEDTMGKMGRLYMPRQEMDKVVLKKPKGAKRKVPEEGEAPAEAPAAQQQPSKKKQKRAAVDTYTNE